MNHASNRFEISASRSWLTCLFVLNCASKTVSLTLPYFLATSLAPSYSAVQYVFAADARKTPMRTVFCWRPVAVVATVAAPAARTSATTVSREAALLISALLPVVLDPKGSLGSNSVTRSYDPSDPIVNGPVRRAADDRSAAEGRYLVD